MVSFFDQGQSNTCYNLFTTWIINVFKQLLRNNTQGCIVGNREGIENATNEKGRHNFYWLFQIKITPNISYVVTENDFTSKRQNTVQWLECSYDYLILN